MKSIMPMLLLMGFSGCATMPADVKTGTVVSVADGNDSMAASAIAGSASMHAVSVAAGAATLGPVGVAAAGAGAIIGLGVKAITPENPCGDGMAIVIFKDDEGVTQTSRMPKRLVCKCNPGDKVPYKQVDRKFYFWPKNLCSHG